MKNGFSGAKLDMGRLVRCGGLDQDYSREMAKRVSLSMRKIFWR